MTGCVIDVDGTPVAQGSKVGFVSRTGRVVVKEQMDARLRVWRTAVRAAATVAWDGPPTDGPIDLCGIFRFRRPKRPTYPYPRPSGDVEKLARAVSDAITGVVVTDDAQVVTWTCRKVYASDDEPSGMTLVVTPADIG